MRLHPNRSQEEERCRLSVILPMFNEEQIIGESLGKIVRYLRGRSYSWEILAVDDGSCDGTCEAVRAFVSRHPDLPILLLEEVHRGKGGTVKAGVRRAKGEFLLLSDADQAMPIEQVEAFLLLAEEGYDFVIGSRWVEGSQAVNASFLRTLTGRVFNALTRALTVKGLNDTQCGFKVMRGEAARMLFERSRIEGFSFDVEILFLAQKTGLRIREHPIRVHYGPKSSLRVGRDSLKMAMEVIGIRWNDLLGRYG